MKMRRHRVFLLCTVGLCVISFLHYYKALHYVSLLRELSAPYPNINSFIMVSGFFWQDRLSPVVPEEAPPPAVVRQAGALEGPRGGAAGGREVRPRGGPAPPLPPRSWSQREQSEADAPTGDRGANGLVHLVRAGPPGPAGAPAPVAKKPDGGGGAKPPPPPPPPHPQEAADVLGSKELRLMGDLHTRIHRLQEDTTSYFVHTKAGALCFKRGTEVSAPPRAERPGPVGAPGQRRPLQEPFPEGPAASGGPSPHARAVRPRATGGRRLVKCVCRPGWHGHYCGVPTMVHHSNLPTKERLAPRAAPRRLINAININHEFDLLHARLHELAPAVDLFLICESSYTAYGERRPLSFLHLLRNGTYDYVRHKILYVYLDHFPEGGRQDGWIADDYLRTFLTRNGMSRVQGVRSDDIFIINDADEIPSLEGLIFLKLFDGWTEPFAIHMRKSLYGFFWKQLGSLEVVSGCTVGMLRDVYDNDGIRLRRREYYTMPGFRRYENDTGHILVQWSIGSPVHFAGWHCSWCFAPEGIYLKLVSAQNGDFPRWGDYEDKRDLGYIRELIRTGGWFDNSVQEFPPTDPREHMYAPRHMLENYSRYRYLLENPYAKGHTEG